MSDGKLFLTALLLGLIVGGFFGCVVGASMVTCPEAKPYSCCKECCEQ